MPRTLQKQFGRNLQSVRVAAGLTQEKLAEKADISLRYVQMLESGAKNPSLVTLSNIRKALDSDYNSLFKGV